MHNSIVGEDRKSFENNKTLTVCEIAALRDEGRYYLSLTWIPRGERERAIYCVNQYFFGTGLGFGRDDERFEAVRSWYFSRREHRGKAEVNRAVSAISRAVFWRVHEKSDVCSSGLSERCIERMIDTRSTLGRFFQANLNRLDRARAKISQAVLWLQQCNMRIGRKAIERISGCHKNTVNKHRDLWKGGACGISRQQGPVSLASEIMAQEALLRSKKETEEKKEKKQEPPCSADVVTALHSGSCRVVDSTPIAEIRKWWHDKSRIRHPRHSLSRAGPNTC